KVGDLDGLFDREFQKERMIADYALHTRSLSFVRDSDHVGKRRVAQVQDDVCRCNQSDDFLQLPTDTAFGIYQHDWLLFESILGNAAFDGEPSTVLADRARDTGVVRRVDGGQPD